MERDRVGEQLLRAALVEVVGVVEVRLEVDLPVALRLDLAVPDAQEVAGQQLLHALEERLAGERELERQVVGEPGTAGLDLGQERQQRIYLRGEIEDVADDRVAQRLDPEAV